MDIARIEGLTSCCSTASTFFNTVRETTARDIFAGSSVIGISRVLERGENPSAMKYRRGSCKTQNSMRLFKSNNMGLLKGRPGERSTAYTGHSYSVQYRTRRGQQKVVTN